MPWGWFGTLSDVKEKIVKVGRPYRDRKKNKRRKKGR